jgi:NhaA family Na+:H+ antiporter
LRNRVYRRIFEEENRDADNDGIPDVHQADQPHANRSSQH